MPPISKTLFALWPLEPEARPMLALLCALARDPLLRDSASAIFEAPVGEPVKWPKIAEVFDTIHRGRFSEKMVRSLSQNCASTWTQSGHLVGTMKKLRARISPTPNVAAFAALPSLPSPHRHVRPAPSSHLERASLLFGRVVPLSPCAPNRQHRQIGMQNNSQHTWHHSKATS